MLGTITTPEPSRHGIGGSQAAAALGVHPYQSPISLWQELVGELPGFEGNERTRWGNVLEPVVRQEYVERHGCAVHVPQGSLYAAHSEARDWARATPDGIVVDADGGGRWLYGLEVKTAGLRVADRWGEEGTDEVPAEYLIQCQHYMAVTGLQRWDVAVLIGGQDYREYRVDRDDEIIATIFEQVGRFWDDHVLARVPPPIDGTDDYRDYLARRYPHTRADYLEADAETEGMVAELLGLREDRRVLEEMIAERENQLRAAIGEAAGLITSAGKLHYKPRRGAPNWKRVAEELAEAHDVDAGTLAELADLNRNRDSRPLTYPRSKK